MNDIKKTFFYLNQTSKRVFLYAMVIAIIADVMELFIAFQLYYSKKHTMMKWCLHDNHIIILVVALMILGFLYGSKAFSGYISIIARRKTYFIGVLSYSTLLSLSCLGINRLITFIITYYIELSIHSGQQYFISIDPTTEWILYTGAISLGLFIGAFYYRASKIVSGIGIGMGVWSTVQSNSLAQIYAYVMEMKQFLLIGCLFIIFFFILSILLLRTAPTQSYAHDLWVKKERVQ